MKKEKIMCANGEIELLEFVYDFYSISEKVNENLKELRIGLSTWIPKESFDKMNVSVWVYNDLNFNAFCHYENDKNYIALSVGLFYDLWNEVNDFVNERNLPLVFKISDENKPRFVDLIFFYMVNFIIAHEFGHIAYGHIRKQSIRHPCR